MPESVGVTSNTYQAVVTATNDEDAAIYSTYTLDIVVIDCANARVVFHGSTDELNPITYSYGESPVSTNVWTYLSDTLGCQVVYECSPALFCESNNPTT